LIGQRIAHYQIESLLGEGGMGRVYKARNTRLDKTCALKILPPELARQDASLLERFIREGRSAAAVEHPNVLPVYFIGRVEENCFIEMQYVDGGNLQDLMHRRGRLAVRSAALIIREVAKALQAAHEKGIIHRDIKPSNVMLSKKGQVFVADFGLAKIGAARTKLTQEGYVLGTPLYMSPEQAMGQGVDHRSDIYSLGVMFFEMLAGRPPFTADTPLVVMMKHREAPIPAVTQFAPDTPPQISTMIQKMMAKNPEERYQNSGEVAKELSAFLSAPKGRRFWPRAMAAVLFMALAAAGVLAFVYKDELQRRCWATKSAEDTGQKAETAAAETSKPPGVRKRSEFRGQRSGTATTPVPADGRRLAQIGQKGQEGKQKESQESAQSAEKPSPSAAIQHPASSIRHPEPPPPLAVPTQPSLALPKGWTSETQRVKVAAPEGEKKKKKKEITYYTNTIGMKLILIPEGEFMMGSPGTEAGRRSDEGPQHKVRITKPFYLGAFEVTQQQYQAIMGKNPAKFEGETNPVESVSWNMAVPFCKRLSQKEGVEYRLPTEAEWEYACRAGSTTPFYTGATISTEQANYDGNYTYGSGQKGEHRQKTIRVGSFPPNSLGLYDMHGNVWEWCQDWYDGSYYANSPSQDPKGPDSGTARVLRGGSWYYEPNNLRSAFRFRLPPAMKADNTGFRVAVVVQE
jgi:formylglycine-generating enzyme required for sulfatase activity/tRNA A-37 threonylcarbamoyl transferase component Bud32